MWTKLNRTMFEHGYVVQLNFEGFMVDSEKQIGMLSKNFMVLGMLL
jgi:hypothetical protein